MSRNSFDRFHIRPNNNRPKTARGRPRNNRNQRGQTLDMDDGQYCFLGNFDHETNNSGEVAGEGGVLGSVGIQPALHNEIRGMGKISESHGDGNIEFQTKTKAGGVRVPKKTAPLNGRQGNLGKARQLQGQNRKTAPQKQPNKALAILSRLDARKSPRKSDSGIGSTGNKKEHAPEVILDVDMGTEEFPGSSGRTNLKRRRITYTHDDHESDPNKNRQRNSTGRTSFPGQGGQSDGDYMECVRQKTDEAEANLRPHRSSVCDAIDDGDDYNDNDQGVVRHGMGSAGVQHLQARDSCRSTANKSLTPSRSDGDDISESDNDERDANTKSSRGDFSDKFRRSHKQMAPQNPKGSQLAIVNVPSTAKKSSQKTMSTNGPIPRKNNSRPTQLHSNNAIALKQQSAEESRGNTKLTLTKVHKLQSCTNAVTKRKRAATRIMPGSAICQSQQTGHPNNMSPPTVVTTAGSSISQSQQAVSLHGDSPASARNKRRRSSRKKSGGKDNVIELLSEDESEVGLPSSQGDASHTPSRQTHPGNRVTMEVPRIAIGRKVYLHGCQIHFQKKKLILRFDDMKRNGHRTIPVDLGPGKVEDIKYFFNPDPYEDLIFENRPPNCFLALKVKPTEQNQLKSYSTSYQFDGEDYRKAFLVVEFGCASDLNKLLSCIRSWPHMGYIDGSAQLHASDAQQYCAALMEATKKGKKRRSATKVTDAFVDGRPEDTVLLVYPFHCNPRKMEEAAKGSMEASDDLFQTTKVGEGIQPSSASGEDDEGDGQVAPSSSSSDDLNVAETNKVDQRRHFLTIQVRDFERLCPGEFLNDTLIDFWIQWITRRVDPLDVEVHCFSSHFFTTLDAEGPAGVEKWTVKKGINVFEKKFIFIPINEVLHWSLCVVVNPGNIMEQDEEDPMTCMLFLDSLKAHQKSKVSNKVRSWLGSEWKRLKGGEHDPFSVQANFPIMTPKIPYQDNSWDCGVFVCRFAYSVYSLRGRSFNRNDRWFEKDLTGCEEFNFGMDDIRRLRQEIMKLIENLSVMYLPWKKIQDDKRKQERRLEKERKRQQQEKAASDEDNKETEATQQGEATSEQSTDRLASINSIDATASASRAGPSNVAGMGAHGMIDLSSKSNSQIQDQTDLGEYLVEEREGSGKENNERQSILSVPWSPGATHAKEEVYSHSKINSGAATEVDTGRLTAQGDSKLEVI